MFFYDRRLCVKTIKTIAFVSLLIICNCVLFHETEPESDPFVLVNGVEDIIGEWVCYRTYLETKHDWDYYNLDIEKEEDVIIIDSSRILWKFQRDGVFYEKDFPYLLNGSWFCKDSVFNFKQYPKHHFGEPFGHPDNEHASVYHNSTDLKLTSNLTIYTVEYSYYTRKTW